VIPFIILGCYGATYGPLDAETSNRTPQTNNY
jgi:hypothetical protein